MVRLAPGRAEIVERVKAGRLYRDGDILVGPDDRAVPDRRKLAFAGIVSVAIAIDKKGALVGRPRVEEMGLPGKTRSGEPISEIVDDAVAEVLSGLPRGKLRDPEAVEDAVARAIRGSLRNAWGKKPACHVMVIEV